QKVIQDGGAGEPLRPAVRSALEASLEVPLGPVRVHSDSRTAGGVDALGPRAFTYGYHVYLGPRERPEDLELMAHEVAHVVQQQGRPTVQTFEPAPRGDAYEREAQQTSAAVQRGERAEVTERTASAKPQ